MKKTALTIGLFSLVVVATSFTNPVTQTLAANDTIVSAPIDGGAVGGVVKKQDRFAMNESKSVNFASVNQSVRNDKKVD